VPVWDTLDLVSRIKARSRVARLAPRLVFVGILAASIVSGVVAGCGIDYEGLLSTPDGLDATERVGANVPEGSADAVSDGPFSDAGLDAEAAPGLACADSRCVDAGGVCTLADNACTFHCDGGTNCDAGLTCPPGVPCVVVCAADNVCQGTIDCREASSCDIACLGSKTCNGVVCSGSTCRVACNGFDSCNPGGITCEAGTCDLECKAEGGANNCKGLVKCESAVGCAVECNMGGCSGGVLAVAPDASIHCGTGACGAGETCRADFCELGCRGGGCASKLCCEAGTCVLLDGGTNSCP
jgi:hypothetical protein